MKTAEEHINDFWGGIRDGDDSRGRRISGYDVRLVIKQAQSEAIDEIVQRCSDRVPLSGLEFYLAGHDLKKELGL